MKEILEKYKEWSNKLTSPDNSTLIFYNDCSGTLQNNDIQFEFKDLEDLDTYFNEKLSVQYVYKNQKSIEEFKDQVSLDKDFTDALDELVDSKIKDWNEMTLDQMVEHLKNKYKLSSTGEAKCINSLIEFYENIKHKPGKAYGLMITHMLFQYRRDTMTEKDFGEITAKLAREIVDMFG